MPGYASWVYCTLGNAYASLGDFNKAIEYHTQHLAIAKEVGDRAGEVIAYGSLGNAYQSQGDFSKAIECWTWRQSHLVFVRLRFGRWGQEGQEKGQR